MGWIVVFLDVVFVVEARVWTWLFLLIVRRVIVCCYCPVNCFCSFGCVGDWEKEKKRKRE